MVPLNQDLTPAPSAPAAKPSPAGAEPPPLADAAVRRPSMQSMGGRVQQLHVSILSVTGLDWPVAEPAPSFSCRVRVTHPSFEPFEAPAVAADAPGPDPAFESGAVRSISLPVEWVAQAQLSLSLWDIRSGGFAGEVLLHVVKLDQIAGKYFQHSFNLTRSATYAATRAISGSMVVGVQLDHLPQERK